MKWRGHEVHRWLFGDQILTMRAVAFSRQSGRSCQEEWSVLRNLCSSHQPTLIVKDKEPKPDRRSTLAEVFFFSSSYFFYSSSPLLWSLLQTSTYCWKKRTRTVFLTRLLWREADKEPKDHEIKRTSDQNWTDLLQNGFKLECVIVSSRLRILSVESTLHYPASWLSLLMPSWLVLVR